MANLITSFRIIFSIVLLFFPAFSKGFFAFYLLAAFTDMIDGTVARKTHTASKFGAKLDSEADFVFMIICLVKILPEINVNKFIWIWVSVIILIKIFNVAIGFKISGKLVVQHSYLNKITGFLMFVFPFTVNYLNVIFTSSIICVVATVAAIYELILICSGKEIL